MRIKLFISLLLLSVSAQGTIWYAATNGVTGNTGAIGSPWDLKSALTTHAASILAGDSIYMRDGSYVTITNDNFFALIGGTSNNPVTLRSYPGEWARVTGTDLRFQSGSGYVICRDFEYYHPTTNRTSYQYTPFPTDMMYGRAYDGMIPYNIGCKFINMYIHDIVGNGVQDQQESTGTEVYGCVIQNVGWWQVQIGTFGQPGYHAAQGRAHSIYAQSPLSGAGTKVFRNNTLLSPYGYGIQAYGSGTITLTNVHILENTIVDSRALTPDHEGGKSIVADNGLGFASLQVLSNCTFSSLPGGSILALGSRNNNKNYDVWCAGNTIWETLSLGDVQTATVTNNWIYSPSKPLDFSISFWTTNVVQNYTWDRNTIFWGAQFGGPATIAYPPSISQIRTYGQWKTNYPALDGNSTTVQAVPSVTNKVFIFPNIYETGRATVTIYNFGLSNTVPVDFSQIMTSGSTYQVYNGANFRGAPVLSGIWTSGNVSLPMTNLLAAVSANGTRPPTTGPLFNTFIVKSTPSGTGVAPIILVTAPADGSSFLSNSVITLSASATAGTGSITNVALLCDAVVRSNFTSAPYTLTMTTNAGTYSITAQVKDDAGSNVTSTAVSFTVTNGVATPPPPTGSNYFNQWEFKSASIILNPKSASEHNINTSIELLNKPILPFHPVDMSWRIVSSTTEVTNLASNLYRVRQTIDIKPNL